MALQLADRVQQTGTANTTVSFTLSGNISGFQSFSSAITTGNTLYYAATDGTNWEVGIGTLTNSTTVTRNTCLSSSNSNAFVSAFSGTLAIWVDYPSGKAVYQDASNNVTLPAQLTAANYVANKTITGALSSGAYSYGTLAYSDVNIYSSYTSSVNSYAQSILQNTNSGITSSVDFIVSNDIGTASTYYGDFGMTSSGYNTPGENIINTASTVYLQSATAPLAIGTLNSNALSFYTNSTLAGAFSSAGLFSTVNDATISTLTVGRGNGALSTNTAFGYQALNATTGNNNTGIGYQAGKAITSGGNNVFVGQYSGVTLTTANYNTGIGHGALNASNANGNTGVGSQALNSVSSGQQNAAFGNQAGQALITGQQNVFLGSYAFYAGVTGSGNVAVGNQAMQQATGVSNMVAVGNSALINTTTVLNAGTTNIGTITGGSGYTNGTYSAVALSRVSGTAVINAGSYGTANITVSGGAVTAVSIVGVGSGYVDTTTVLTVSNTLIGSTGTGFQFTLTGSLLSPSNIVGIGSGVLSTNTTGSSLTVIGTNAGSAVTTGSNSVLIGTGSGSTGTNTTTGFQLVYIGSGSRGSAANNQNEIAIGYNAVGLGSNTTVIGNSSTTLTQVYGIFKATNYTVATLPSASTSGVGAMAFVTDALTPVFGATVAGGGAVATPVYSDGAAWKVG
jgi:hypothetical protein